MGGFGGLDKFKTTISVGVAWIWICSSSIENLDLELLPMYQNDQGGLT